MNFFFFLFFFLPQAELHDNVIPILGIDALEKHNNDQSNLIVKQKENIKKVEEVVNTLKESMKDIQTKIFLLKQKQINLQRSALQVLKKIEVLRCHGNPLQPKEIQ